MRKAKEKAVYRNAALAILRDAGAQLVDQSSSRMYKVETTLGTLEISVWDSCTLCRFNDLDQAKAHFGPSDFRLNQFSGKWNFNGGLTHAADMQDLENFKQQLAKLLPESLVPNPTLPLVPWD